MSFRDELSSLTPTQKQIQVKATSEAQTNARLDYSGVKDLLRSKAQHNEYTTIGNHKYISCYYPDSYSGEPEAAEYVRRVCETRTTMHRRGLFSGQVQETSCVISYVITNQSAYDEYLKELQRLAAEDDIRISVVGYNKLEKRTEISIPRCLGSTLLANNYMYRIKLSVSITF